MKNLALSLATFVLAGAAHAYPANQTIELQPGSVITVNAAVSTTVSCVGQSGVGQPTIVARSCQCAANDRGNYNLVLTMLLSDGSTKQATLATYGYYAEDLNRCKNDLAANNLCKF